MRKVSILVLLACVVVSCPLFAVSDEAKSAIEQLRSKHRAGSVLASPTSSIQANDQKPSEPEIAQQAEKPLQAVATSAARLAGRDLFAAIEAGDFDSVQAYMKSNKNWWKETFKEKTPEKLAWDLWMSAEGPESEKHRVVYAYIFEKNSARTQAKRNYSSGPSVSRGSGSSSSSSSSGSVHVRGYYRKDGTYVRSHTRRR